MKNIEDLIQKALELQSNGLVTGQIADELNVSRETVTWLLTRSKKEAAAPAPKDISVNWSSIGKSAGDSTTSRLHSAIWCMRPWEKQTLKWMRSLVSLPVVSP